MNRRNFLRALIGGVAAGAAVRTWPFRVYSFPSEPVLGITDGVTLFNASHPLLGTLPPDRIVWSKLTGWIRESDLPWPLKLDEFIRFGE